MNLITSCKCSINGARYELADLNVLKEKNPNSGTLSHLICIYCGCKLEFHMKTDRRKAFLSTWPNEKHDENCSFYFEYEKRVTSSSYNTSDTYLNSNEIKSKVDYMYKKMHESLPEHSKNSKNNKRHKSPRNTSGTLNKRIKKNRGSVKASDQSSDDSSSGTRMTYRQPGNITLKDAGKSITLGGTLSKIVMVNSNYAIFYITNDSGVTEKVYTSPDYFNQNIIGLEDRINAVSDILYKKDSGQEFICLVYATLNNSGEIELYLYEERHMFFPRIPIGVYISLNK